MLCATAAGGYSRARCLHVVVVVGPRKTIFDGRFSTVSSPVFIVSGEPRSRCRRRFHGDREAKTITTSIIGRRRPEIIIIMYDTITCGGRGGDADTVLLTSARCWNRANQTGVFVFICAFFSSPLFIYTRQNGIVHARVRSYVSESKRFTHSDTNFTYFVRLGGENLSSPQQLVMRSADRVKCKSPCRLALHFRLCSTYTAHLPPLYYIVITYDRSTSDRICGTKPRRIRTVYTHTHTYTHSLISCSYESLHFVGAMILQVINYYHRSHFDENSRYNLFHCTSFVLVF